MSSQLPRSQPVAHKEFFEFIKSSAELRLDIYPFQDDQKKLPPKIEQRNVFFAVDADMLIMYLTPSKAGPGRGYGSIFKDATKEESLALASTLAHFIFVKLPEITNRPLIILPGHLQEFQNHSERFRNDAKKMLGAKKELEKYKKARKDILKHLIGSLGTSSIDPTKTGKFFFQNENPGVIYLRLMALFKRGLIAPLENAINFGNFFDETNKDEMKKIFLSFNNHKRKNGDSWRQKLEKKTRSKVQPNLKNDSQALQCLENINKQFHELDKECSLVLITGDKNLFESASEYYPYGQGQNSFARMYLRNYRAFLIESPVILPQKRKENEQLKFILHWLDALLVTYTNSPEVNEEQIRKIVCGDKKTEKEVYERIANALKNDPYTLMRVKRDWKRHVDNLVDYHFTSGEFTKEEMVRVLGKENIGSVLNSIDTKSGKLEDKLKKTYNDFFMSVGPTSSKFIESLEFDQWRYVPPITFNRFPKTKEAIRKFVISMDEELSPDKLITLKTIPQNEDKTEYASILAYSYLYAHLDRWYVASLFAQYAIDIAEDLMLKNEENNSVDKQKSSIISGREAYYLKAVLQRFQPELKVETLGLLEKAEEAYKKDRDGFGELPVSNLRFEVEKANLELYCKLWEIFQDSEKEIDVFQFKSDLKVFLDLHNRVQEINEKWILISVDRNILSQIFVIGLLLEKNRSLDRETIHSLERMENSFQRNLKSKSVDGFLLPISGYAKMISIYAKIKFGRLDEQIKKETMIKLAHDLKSAKLTEDEDRAHFDKALINLVIESFIIT